MKFTPSPLAGVWTIDIDPQQDERGFFARTFCSEEFARHGLVAAVAQSSLSFNPLRGTLRGMHFQATPHEEDKLVRCTRGAVFDAVVDLRSGSPSWGKWFATELTADNRRAVFVPKGFAHGFLTLAEDSEVLYQMSAPFAPGFARGLRWNDPEIGIAWPMAPALISERDAAYPCLADF